MEVQGAIGISGGRAAHLSQNVFDGLLDPHNKNHMFKLTDGSLERTELMQIVMRPYPMGIEIRVAESDRMFAI
jgi:hypothetical protein